MNTDLPQKPAAVETRRAASVTSTPHARIASIAPVAMTFDTSAAAKVMTAMIVDAVDASTPMICETYVGIQTVNAPSANWTHT